MPILGKLKKEVVGTGTQHDWSLLDGHVSALHLLHPNEENHISVLKLLHLPF